MMFIPGSIIISRVEQASLYMILSDNRAVSNIMLKAITSNFRNPHELTWLLYDVYLNASHDWVIVA